ncbi:MAG: hypothetical protein LAT76_01195 [Schleiferiaceae bacterium]|nr:hypothetical protein [Schleiferiaceae bacterium]
MKTPVFLSLSFLCLLFTSCIPDEKPSVKNFRDFNLNGAWEFPIANVSLTLEDLVTDLPLLNSAPGQPISLFFRQDDAFSLSIADFVEIEDQEVLNTSFLMGPSFFAFDSEIGSTLGIELYQLNLASGFLNWEAFSNVTDTLVFEIQFLNAQRNGAPVTWQITTFGGAGNGQIALSDLAFDMTTGPEPHSNLAIRLDHVNASTAFLGENFNIALSIENFTPAYVEGFFGDRQIPIPSSSFEVDYGGLGRIVDGVFFTDPQMRLFLSNQIGLPLEVTTNITGSNRAGLSTALGLPSLQLNAPLFFGDSAGTLYEVNANNSQIVDFLRILPNQFNFSGDIALNPPFAPSQTNFVGFESTLRGDLELELPLSFGAENIVFEQDIIGVDLNIDDADAVEEIALRFLTKNTLPLAINLELIWYDANNTPVDSVRLPLLQAPNVDNNGRSIDSASEEVWLSFTDERVQSFIKTRKITLRGFFETSNGGSAVSLYPDNGLEIRLGSRIKLSDKAL